VKQAEPYLVGHTVMTLPDGGFEDVLVVGCDPTSLLGGAKPAFGVDADQIRRADGIFVDIYESGKLGRPQLGDIREIGRRRARIVGFTQGILGFLVTPYVFTTIDRAAEFLNRGSTVASYFLVQVEDDVSAEEVCRKIRERLPDLEAYTRRQYAGLTIGYWLQRTGLGISFGAATAIGLVVGLIIVGQTMYASVLDRLVEFGTLKAIGAQEWQVRAVILQQALMLAVVGSVAGLLCVLVVQGAFSTPRAPITIPWYIALGSCLVVTVVCLVASLLPYLRVRAIDPAMVLQT
jgi:putative ABC transport system permease protein